MEHQDWETHIVHCKMGNATNVKKQNNSKKKRHNYYNKEDKLNSQIEDGKLKHKKISNDLKEEFKKWRNSSGFTQKHIANKLAVPVQMINKFENGTMNHDPKLVSKIKRIMN